MEVLLETESSKLTSRPSGLSESFLSKCVDEVEEFLTERPQITLYGKVCQQNRYVRFFSDVSEGYRYSGNIAKPQPLGKSLSSLIRKTNRRFGTSFNGILVNKYLDGSDSIGKHSDEESKLDKDGVVALSVGAERKFRVRCKRSGKILVDAPTVSGNYLHMSGHFQREFTHEIPVQKRIKEPRWSFTFRNHI